MDLNCKVLKVMMTKTQTSSSSSPLKIDRNEVFSPVVDGNEVTTEVPVPKVGDNNVVSQNKVKIEVPVLRKLLLPMVKTVSHPDRVQLLVQNYENFKKSGEPTRFMCYRNGSWVNFKKNVMGMLISGFASGKPVIDVEMEGFKRLYDFYRMLEIDLVTGVGRSIAWFDVNGNGFFPRVSVDSSEDDLVDFDMNKVPDVLNVSGNPKFEIEVKISDKLGKRKRENEGGEESSMDVKERHVIDAANELNSARWTKARALTEEEREYQMVKGLFLSGLRAVEPGFTVTAIHQCTRTGPFENVRFEVFQKNMEIMKRARGEEANIIFAWYEASAKDVEIILCYGFGVPSSMVLRGSNSHGVGIYLSPLCSPQNSAMMSGVDEYGEKHMILCRVILGKLEKVELGSQQLYPSSVDFDSGVDDLKNPRSYVVWPANMNTHILPEYVVSFRLGRRIGAPYVSNVVVALISKLCSTLPPPKAHQLQCLYNSYLEGKLGGGIFKRQLKSVVGEEILRPAIVEILAKR